MDSRKRATDFSTAHRLSSASTDFVYYPINQMKDLERKIFWVDTQLKREEIDQKRVSFNVQIEAIAVHGYGHLRYKTRESDDQVSIDLVFNVPDPARAGNILQEIHGLPQAAANQIKETGNSECPLDLEFCAEIRNV